jgi:hypothetical protein
MRCSPKACMMDFPVLFPEKPKPPLIWPKRLLPTVVPLVGASVALVGASTIATYLVMPWISTSGTMTAFEDRLIIHSHEAILSHPTNEGLGTHIEAILDTTPRPLPVSSTRTITPRPTIITPAHKPLRIDVNSGRCYMFLPPFLHGMADVSAPFYRWKQSEQFRSTAKCERFRQQAINDTVKDREQDTTKLKSLYDGRIKLLAVASCVSAHDPRMKELQ